MSRYPRFLATSIPGCPARCSFARSRHMYVSTTLRSGFPCTHTLRSNSGLPTTRCDSRMRTASRSYSRGVRSRGTPLNSILNRFSFKESADSTFYLLVVIWLVVFGLVANSYDIYLGTVLPGISSGTSRRGQCRYLFTRSTPQTLRLQPHPMARAL